MHLRGGQDRAVVLGREVRDARQRVGGGGEVASLGLVKRGDLLLERDLLLDVGLARGVLLEQVRQVVPAMALLEQAREGRMRRFVGAVDREELLPRVDCAFDVPEVPLAEAGDLAEPLLAGVDRLAGDPQRREQHVAERGVLALGAQVVLDPREGLGMLRVSLEDLAVLLVGVAALPGGANDCAASSRPCSRSVDTGARRIPPLLPGPREGGDGGGGAAGMGWPSCA